MQINTFRTKVETCCQVDVWVRTEDLAPKVAGLTCASVGSAHARRGERVGTPRDLNTPPFTSLTVGLDPGYFPRVNIVRKTFTLHIIQKFVTRLFSLFCSL